MAEARPEVKGIVEKYRQQLANFGIHPAEFQGQYTSFRRVGSLMKTLSRVPPQNMHSQVRIKSQDERGRESLAQYTLRSPFSQEKMAYRKDTRTVPYRSKMNPVSKKNFAVFPALDWIATLTAPIPNKGEQLVRYYGYYSNVSRGKRKREKPKEETRLWKYSYGVWALTITSPQPPQRPAHLP